MKLTRRQFIGSSIALVGSTMIPQWSFANFPTNEASYRALVCISLGGGADSFNMIVPTDASSYAQYVKRRGNLALSQDQLLPLKLKDGKGRSYAFHQGLRELRKICDIGEATVVTNVGPQTAPHTAFNKNFQETLSHREFISRWHKGAIDDRAQSGWAGRVADLFTGSPYQGSAPTNISMAGLNLMQQGSRALTVNLQSNPYRQSPLGYSETDFSYISEQLALELANCRQPNRLHHSITSMEDKREQSERFIRECIADTVQIETRFESDPFSTDLKQVAQLIAARDKLGTRRQIFFVQLDGWDHHHNLLEGQNTMLPILSRGLSSFREAMIEQGVFDHVTTFTQSEFGRSLESSGTGSDHGWAGHQFVMGGGLQANQIFGEYPDLACDNPLDIGGGCYKPTTSMDEFLAELVLWLGVPAENLPYVLPDFSFKSQTGQSLGILA